MFQGNYAFSKVLSDSASTIDSRLEHFLDLANPKIERARSEFDFTHAIKANGSYDLPFGNSKRFDYRPLNRIISGWIVSGDMTWISGPPFSLLSGRGTLNRASGSRSFYNTPITFLNKGQLDDLLQFRMTGDGPFFVAESAKGTDGRAVAPDGAQPFAGQAFFHPGPGQIGSLQRRMFSGPWIFDMNMAVMKDTKIAERHEIRIRADAFNVFNHPTFFVGNQAVSSVNFGRITTTLTGRRQLMFSLSYRF
jgi:hypothetical protein